MADQHYTTNTARARELAEAHAAWLFDLMGAVAFLPGWVLKRYRRIYVDAFVHAYGHGVEDERARQAEGVDRADP